MTNIIWKSLPITDTWTHQREINPLVHMKLRIPAMSVVLIHIIRIRESLSAYQSHKFPPQCIPFPAHTTALHISTNFMLWLGSFYFTLIWFASYFYTNVAWLFELSRSTTVQKSQFVTTTVYRHGIWHTELVPFPIFFFFLLRSFLSSSSSSLPSLTLIIPLWVMRKADHNYCTMAFPPRVSKLYPPIFYHSFSSLPLQTFVSIHSLYLPSPYLLRCLHSSSLPFLSNLYSFCLCSFTQAFTSVPTLLPSFILLTISLADPYIAYLMVPFILRIFSFSIPSLLCHLSP